MNESVNRRRVRLAITTVAVAATSAYLGHISPANATPTVIPAEQAGQLRPGDVTTKLRCFEDDSCRLTVVYLVEYRKVITKLGPKKVPVWRVLARTSWCMPGGYCERH